MSTPERPLRRKRAVAGVVGLAAVLGGAAYVTTTQLTGNDSAVTTDNAAPPAAATAPAAAASGPAAPTSAPGEAPTRPAAVPSTAARATTTTPRPRTTAEIIAQVKGTAAKATRNVKRPLVPAGAPAATDVTVTQSGSPTATGGLLRVVTARGDLTGQRELSWVAGQKGERVGAARCTQTIRISPDVPARERPTLLLCWRTSAAKSVYTLAINHRSRPSAQASVTALTTAWNRL